MSAEFLWYIPNQVESGHRGDVSDTDPSSLETLTSHALALEQHGWKGALIGAGWGRPDTFTVAAALAARTTTFEPLIAIRPGYWRPANFASAAATLDELTGGRVRVNIVSGQDKLAAYGDTEGDQAHRYGRTRDFMRLVRRLWTEEDVTFESEHFCVVGSTLAPRITPRGERRHPRLYFGGASEAAQRVAATEADVQLFWGEPLDGVAERIARLKQLSRELDRDLLPLEFGLRITTLVRDTTEEAWADAEAKVDQMAVRHSHTDQHRRAPAVGQQRLLDLQAQGDVLDDNLYTAPGRYGGGGAGTTWLVGSAADVARSLRRYQDLGITHFVLSDTPYLAEIQRQGDQLLPLFRDTPEASGSACSTPPRPPERRSFLVPGVPGRADRRPDSYQGNQVTRGDHGGAEPVASGGLLHRRALLVAGATSAGGLAMGARGAVTRSPASMLAPGAPIFGYGARARSSEAIQRIVPDLPFPGSGSSRTPLQLLEETITPNGLHFERHHNGVPGAGQGYHSNMVQSWQVDRRGRVSHVYA